MKKLPVGEPSFAKIRNGDQLYVDKTEYYHRLLTAGGGYYFLSRPRRFGKSLLVSTLQSLFKGEKRLFEGLWIYDKHDFEPRPVILLSFTDVDFKGQTLETAIANQLQEIAESYGETLSETTSRERFSELIRKLGKKRQVAVLVDEYDKPIIDYFDDLPKAVENRDWLRNFFGVLKALDVVPHLHFVFITGVSKFSKVSLFSELNHLSDITVEKDFAGMLGITQAEMEASFADRIEQLQQKFGLSKEALLDRIRRQYNGYSWDGETLVYNPFSLLRFFASQTFGNYWFTSGTASFLIKAIKKAGTPLEELEDLTVSGSFFDKYDIEKIDLYSLMWQTGYLSIRKVTERNETYWYTLGYPNGEVRNAFNQHLLEEFSGKPFGSMSDLMFRMENALLDGKPDDFIKGIKALFAGIPFEALPRQQRNKAKVAAMWEGYFQSMTLLIVKVLGFSVQGEVSTSRGRVDAVFETPKHVYLVEFKLDDSAEAALKQIKEKDYPAAFLNTSKQVFLFAIAFSSKTRNVSEHLVERAGGQG